MYDDNDKLHIPLDVKQTMSDEQKEQLSTSVIQNNNKQTTKTNKIAFSS